jgi:hypothetical protein
MLAHCVCTAQLAIKVSKAICANAWGSHWHTHVGGKEGKGIKGDCPSNIG